MTGKDPFVERLCEKLVPKSRGMAVRDVRVGLAYVYVELEGQKTGVSALVRNDLDGSCAVYPRAGSLVEQSAETLLMYLVQGKSPVEKAVGLAAANALIGPPPSGYGTDALDLLDLTPQDRVAMVGFFQPLVEKIEGRGIPLSILERNARRGSAILDEKDQNKALAECSIAIITATTLLNGTLGNVLDRLGEPRHAAILGPSTPALPEMFQGTVIDHLGGSVVSDHEKIRTIISQGGGTRQMRPYLRFFNLQLDGKGTLR